MIYGAVKILVFYSPLFISITYKSPGVNHFFLYFIYFLDNIEIVV